MDVGEHPVGVATGRREHWDRVHATHDGTAVSWYQRAPIMSLDLIRSLGVGLEAAVLDVGGGSSNLVDVLLDRGFLDVTVLDIAPAALAGARRRLGAERRVHWVEADLLSWRPHRRYDLWHDRALLHFFTVAEEREGYLAVLRSALATRGRVVVGTFAEDGPERCSGLAVRRYSPSELAGLLEDAGLSVVETRREMHRTPAGVMQPFTWAAALSTV